MLAAADEKGYVRIRHRLFIAQRDHLSTYLICSLHPFPFQTDIEERYVASALLSFSFVYFLFALGFYRNNMLIARRRSLKSAPINSRDFWRNFVPSHCNRNVFRKILFARAFRRLERTLPYRVTYPPLYIYHRRNTSPRSPHCVAFGNPFFSRSKYLIVKYGVADVSI